jgi:hypothetical protein
VSIYNYGGGISGDMVREFAPGRKEILFEERIKGTTAGAEMCTFDPHIQNMHRGDLELLLDTSWSRCQELGEAMKTRGIKPEWEIMSLSDLNWVNELIALGYDEPPYYINIVLGTNKLMSGATAYTPKNLQRFVEDLPEGSLFCVSGSARRSFRPRCTPCCSRSDWPSSKGATHSRPSGGPFAWIVLPGDRSGCLSRHPLMVLNHLADLGVRLSIDDFRTGFSSMSYLKWLRIDELKGRPLVEVVEGAWPICMTCGRIACVGAGGGSASESGPFMGCPVTVPQADLSSP